MKNTHFKIMGFLTILLLAFALASTAQCDVTKCVNELMVANSTTTAAQPTYLWAIAPTLGFTGQGTASISVADVGSIVQNYTITLTVTDGITGCQNTDTYVLCVQQGTATLTLPTLCANEPCIPVSGGSGTGTYFLNGNSITQLCPSDNGQTITFTSSGSGCPGTATAVFNVNPVPTIGVTFN
jgi:hypothetical protein